MEVIVRNVIAGSMAQRLGLKEGIVPSEPVYDICYKSEELGDPIINDYHAVVLGLVTKEELAEIYEISKKVNDVLRPVFDKAGIILVDFKIEFGGFLTARWWYLTKLLRTVRGSGTRLPARNWTRTVSVRTAARLEQRTELYMRDLERY